MSPKYLIILLHFFWPTYFSLSHCNYQPPQTFSTLLVPKTTSFYSLQLLQKETTSQKAFHLAFSNLKSIPSLPILTSLPIWKHGAISLPSKDDLYLYFGPYPFLPLRGLIPYKNLTALSLMHCLPFLLNLFFPIPSAFIYIQVALRKKGEVVREKG